MSKKILFANKWRTVIDEEIWPGNVLMYKIEDEPGHYDYIHNPIDIKND